MNNPFEYMPDEECRAAFRNLLEKLEAIKKSDDPDDAGFIRELESGKMLGVLIAVDDCGDRHTLYAFSGQLGNGGFYHEGFVGPVFDYLQPDGYFKLREADISRQTGVIARYEEETLSKIRIDYERKKAKAEEEISEFREACRMSKMERNARRASGVTAEESGEMIRQSQYEKAELHRLKKRLAAELQPLSDRLAEARLHLSSLKERRRADSEALQNWLFTNFRLLNARGESMSLSQIFAETPMGIPPSGAGECCAPKLLQAAYQHGWKPVSIAEYWYGRSKDGEVRIHGEHYPACRGKCLPVLGWMLRGLEIEPPLDSVCRTPADREPEIIFENRWFCVVNKPCGMLSVPGKRGDLSVEKWLTDRYGTCRRVKMAHRLDQDTSGLLIATFDSDSYKVMQSLFATRRVRKTYVADLEGDYESLGVARKGRIDVPLAPDWLDRPRQRIDFTDGKDAVTDYEFISSSEGCSRIKFYPQTGRTHQLRVHAASPSGLGMPIVGDRLYGKYSGSSSTRLHLHAHRLEFIFPTDGESYIFETPVPF